jgi:hypothetical protein
MEELVKQNPDGSTEGRDPKSVSREALHAAGHQKQPKLDLIRAKCIDCCAGDKSEIVKCTAIGCALWPYRMGEDPFALPRGRGNQAGLKQAAKLAEKDQPQSGPTQPTGYWELFSGVRQIGGKPIRIWRNIFQIAGSLASRRLSALAGKGLIRHRLAKLAVFGRR